MVKRVLGVLAAVVLLVLLSPSAAMACGISYEAGGNADCGGSDTCLEGIHISRAPIPAGAVARSIELPAEERLPRIPDYTAVD